MASTYTVKIESVCSGGEHITLGIYKDGSKDGRIEVTKSDIVGTDLTWKDVIAFLLRKAVNNAGATTAAQRKAAIEAVQVTL